MYADSDLFLINRSCTWKEVGDQVIILQTSSIPPVTHELNETGSFVWLTLKEEGRDLQYIVKALSDEFEVEEGIARKDASELLSTLEDKGLVRRNS